MGTPLKILLLEDAVADVDLLAHELKQAKMVFTLRCVDSRVAFINALDEYAPDVILSDYSLPDFDGISALQIARERTPNIPFIFVSGTLGEEQAVESLKHGASDYVVKGDLHRLATCITRALKEKQLRREREITLQKLRASEEMFKTLAEQAPVGIVLANADATTNFYNQQWSEITGRDEQFMSSKEWSSMLHADDSKSVHTVLINLYRDHKQVDIDYRIVRPSGEVRWVNNRMSCQLQPDGTPSSFISLLTDNTEKKLAEEKIIRLSRIHAMLSSINAAMVRVSDRDLLIRDACQLIITKGNFRLSWIGLFNTDCILTTSAFEVAEQLDVMPDWLPSVGMSIDVSNNCKQTFETGQPLLIDNLAVTPGKSGHVEWLRQLDIASIIYLPIMLGDKVSGVIALCANTTDFFTGDEVRLLTELSKDIAFALDHIEKEAKLNYLAYYDALTELPNRTLFINHLKQCVENAKIDGQQMVLIIFDADKFRRAID